MISENQILFDPKKYVVYLHWNENNQIIYIGYGDNKRPFVKGRNSRWEEYIKNNNYYISIYAFNLSKEDAVKLEKSLIIDHYPKGTLLNANPFKTKKLNQPKPLKKQILTLDIFRNRFKHLFDIGACSIYENRLGTEVIVDRYVPSEDENHPENGKFLCDAKELEPAKHYLRKMGFKSTGSIGCYYKPNDKNTPSITT
jgi:hypothetical protein